MASALAHGVPVVSSSQLLTWLDGRNGSSYSGTCWTGNTLSFTVNVGAGANGLTGMVPTTGTGGSTLSTLTLAGSPVAFTKTTIKGVEYAMFLATAGNYAATYTRPRRRHRPGCGAPSYTARPRPHRRCSRRALPRSLPPRGFGRAGGLFGERAATAGRHGRGHLGHRRERRRDTAIRSATGQSGRSATTTPPDVAHTVVATKLQPGSTYYYRVKSVDAAGNATQWPAATDPPATFIAAATGVADLTAEQFRTVSSQTGTSVQQDGLGEVSLAPAAAAEFNTASLPSDWDQQSEATGGQTVLRRGNLLLDGNRAGTKAQFGPGSSLVFRATFTRTGTQWAGFAAGTATDPWAMFGLRNGTLYAAAEQRRAADDPARGPGRHRAPVPDRLEHYRFHVLRGRQPDLVGSLSGCDRPR